MSSTDENRARELAAALFDEIVAPLAETRRRAGAQAYFPLGPETGATSYFDVPADREMQPAEFEFPGGGTSTGLIDALVAYWTAQGEAELAALAPRLKEIAQALADEAAEHDGKVSILCYTMF
ncbi:MAG: hypothetical protein AB7O59_15240 [Pirellulales bacterium]